MIPRLKGQKVQFSLSMSQDASEMVNFHNSYYGTERKPEHWLWEYQMNEKGKSVTTLARDDGKLIATQCMIPICMDIGFESVLTGKGEDTLILPPYRGTGVMGQLYEYAVANCIERGMQFIWGFTPAIKAVQQFGFTYLFDCVTMIRPGKMLAGIASRLKMKAPYRIRLGSIGKMIMKSMFSRYSIPPIEERLDYEVRVGLSNEHDIQNLYERLKQNNTHVISIKLDPQYLKWRIREHPFLKYDEYQVYQGDVLRAYAFVTLFEGIASISDLTSEDDYATSRLLQIILTNYRKKASSFRFFGNPADCLAQNVFPQLRRFGFRLSGNDNFVLRDLTKGKRKQIFDIQNWHINGLWTEGYSM